MHSNTLLPAPSGAEYRTIDRAHLAEAERMLAKRKKKLADAAYALVVSGDWVAADSAMEVMDELDMQANRIYGNFAKWIGND